jgi:hypothetical protein
MASEPDVSTIVPPNRSTIRHRLPSTGSSGRVPPLPGYSAVLRLPVAPPAALRCLRLAVPRMGSLFAPRRGEPACLGPGLGHPVARPGLLRGDDRASQVPGHPPCTHAPLSDPGGISVPGHSRHLDAAFRCCDDVGFHAYQLSGLYHAACALPVYASQRRLPERHATLGSGWWPAFAGRDWLPAGMLRGFLSSLPTSHPPSPGFAWRNTTFDNFSFLS